MLNGAQGLTSRIPDRRIAVQWAVCLLLVIGFGAIEGTLALPTNAAVPPPAANYAVAAPVLQPATPSSTPTLTPTRIPSQVARLVSRAGGSVPGQPQVDANTIAMYHFDSPADTQAIDATGHHTGTFQGDVSVASEGQYAGALRAFPNGRVIIGNMGDLRQGTIEAFVDFSGTCKNALGTFPFVIAGPDPANGQVNMVFGSYNYTNNPVPTVGLSIKVDGVWQTVIAGINSCRYLVGKAADYWPYEAWRYHHVAATWGPRGMEVWVDGVLHGLNSNPGGRQTCNPQEQIYGGVYSPFIDYSLLKPWSGYPLCPRPVFSYAPAAGTYTGGLPPYNAVQIAGCAPGMGCFDGLIDEIRISNIQRIFDWKTTDPTSTPTVTRTPVQPRAYSVDPYTLALYHMDSVSGSLTYDEVSHQRATANQPLVLVPGRYGAAVELDGSTGIYLPSPGGPSNGTIEAWVKFASDADPLVIYGGLHYYGGILTLLGKNNILSQNLIFGVFDDISWHVADSGIKPSSLVGSWHHVAGTYGANGLQIWIDGVLRGTAPYQGKPIAPYYHRVGCNGGSGCIKGQIDEFRYSSIQRYFAPAATPTPVFFASPASRATTTVQAVAPGLSNDDEARLNGMINPAYRSLTQPGGSSSTDRLAAPSGGTPVLAAAAAIDLAPPPLAGSTPQNIAKSSALTEPLSVDRPLDLDANAVAVYRLNSQHGITLSDATGNYPAILFGDATIKSTGDGRQALALSGGLSYAQVSHFNTPESGTVEAWASFDANPGQMTIVAARHNNAPRFLLGVRADENLSLGFGVYSAVWQWADSGLTPRSLGSGWHHLAGTWGPRGVEIWIDGTLRGVNPYNNGIPDSRDDTLLVGWSPGSAGMVGQISQIRLSKTQRSY